MNGGPQACDAFAGHHRPLTLFALAVAGRPLRLVRCGLPVEAARLPRPGEDPGTVRVGTAGGADAGRMWRIAVLREVLRTEDAGPSQDTRRPQDPRPQARLAGHRGVRRAHAALHARLVATLERARVDAALPRRWPGAAGDLARLAAAARARRPAAVPRHPVRALVDLIERASLGAPVPGSIDPLGLRDRAFAELASLRATGARAADVGRAADRLVAAIVAAAGGRPAAGPALRVLAPAGGPHADDAPDGAAGADAGTGGRDLPGDGLGTAPLALAGGAAAARTGLGAAPDAAGFAEAPAQDAPRDDPAPRRPAIDPAPRRAAPGGVLHDEWDYLGARWLRGWCRVHERRLRGTDTGFVDDVRRRHPELARALRERFSRMRPAGRQRAGRVGDGDELDLDGLVEAVLDRRAGHASDERAYARREPARRDVAAAFLVDMSASTAVALPGPQAGVPAAAAPDPAPWADTGALLYGAYDDAPAPAPDGPRRRVVDVEKDALALMADALATLGDACAVYGFSGHGRDDVEFHVAKDFADPPSRSSWAAIAAIEPRGSTRMGAAIRHAAAKLAREPAARRLLVVVSDGYPQDTDYGPDRLDEEYGIQDTARALRDLESAGIDTFCVTVDPAGHDYLRRMCPPRRYLVIDDVPALPAELARAYAALTGRG